MSNKRIDLILKARDKHYEESGEYLSYGRFCNKYPEKLPPLQIVVNKRQRKPIAGKLSDDVKDIVALYEAGTEVKDIAEKYHVSGTSIRRRLTKCGVYTPNSKKTWTPEALEKLKELMAARVPYADIAVELDCTVCAVSNAATYYDLRDLRKKNTADGTVIPNSGIRKKV